MEEEFDSLYSKFIDEKDRYESQYIFVIHNSPIESVLDKIHKILNIFDDISNPGKKGFLKSKIGTLMKQFEGIKSETTINGIYLVSKENKINEFELKKYWKDTLTHFDCENILVKYGEFFDIDWLKHLLLNRSFIHILHIKNNNLRHIHLNKTKKKIANVKEEKKMDLVLYVQENIPKDNICLIHGVSGLLKSIKDNAHLKVLNGDKKDDQLLEEHDKIINEQNAKELQFWLDNLLNPKEGKKIVFGDEIKSNIKMKLLKTLFCTENIKNKIIAKVPKDEQIFEMKIVKSFDSTDVGKRLETDFKGALGVKYY